MEFEFETNLTEKAKTMWAKEQAQEAALASALDPPGSLAGNGRKGVDSVDGHSDLDGNAVASALAPGAPLLALALLVLACQYLSFHDPFIVDKRQVHAARR